MHHLDSLALVLFVTLNIAVVRQWREMLWLDAGNLADLDAHLEALRRDVRDNATGCRTQTPSP